MHFDKTACEMFSSLILVPPF